MSLYFFILCCTYIVHLSFEFEEFLSEQNISKNALEERAEELLCDDTLVPEIDRIYEGAHKEFTVGNPVHYIIQTDSKKACRKITDILMSALYANNRIQSRRYCSIAYTPHDTVPDDILDKFFESCTGTAVVVSYTLEEQDDSEYASENIGTISDLCETIRKYKNSVLSVICLPKSCENIKEAFYSNLGDITIVELSEEIVFGEKAKGYLCQLAKSHNIKADERLLSFVTGERTGYNSYELSEHFDRWFGRYMKTEVFPQYSDFAIAQTMIQNTVAKGDAYSQLQSMIGLTEAKKVIARALDYRKAQLLFKQHGMKADKNSMNMVFTGNPGTAKTTVARLFAQIMKDNGLLSKGGLYEVGRADLVGKYVGWTAKIVKSMFQKAKGGVLFIDEAYSLVDERSGMYGDEAINTIVQEMENSRDDIVVIFAGYPKEMERFLERNPGLRSRIAFHIPFEDYTPDELYEIAQLISEQKGMVLSDDTKELLIPEFRQAAESADFGNGRYVRNLIEQAKMCQASRLMRTDPQQVTKENINRLECQDFEFRHNPQQAKFPVGFSG